VAKLDLFKRLIGYGLCAAGLAYCSASPTYQQLPPGSALLRLSMTIPGALVGECRLRTADELERLAPNMRDPKLCPRERAGVNVQLEVDGITRVDEALAPRGLARDGEAALYRRILVPAGAHRITARVNDDARQTRFAYVGEASIDLAPGAVLTIDFDRKAGRVVFR
jgi:hypothetical protein